MQKHLNIPLVLSAGVMMVVGFAVAPLAANAASTTTVNAVIGNSASVSSTSGTVNLSITPAVGGSFTSASDTVIAGTNNALGYKLQVSAATTALTKGVDTIAAGSGTPASPVALANNTWGYRVDGQFGFGAGPTSAQTNQASLTGNWAGVTTSAVAIKNVTTATASDSTTVWYGAAADNSKPTGTYTTSVTYTAVTN